MGVTTFYEKVSTQALCLLTLQNVSQTLTQSKSKAMVDAHGYVIYLPVCTLHILVRDYAYLTMFSCFFLFLITIIL